MNQVIEQKYIDKQKTSSVLTNLFGSNFSVEDTGEHFILNLPRALTQAEIKSMRTD